MKRNLFFIALSLLIGAWGFSQCSMNVSSELGTNQPNPACSGESYTMVRNVIDGWGAAASGAAQVWALHNADEVRDLDATDTNLIDPECSAVGGANLGCTVSNNRCIGFGTDNCSSWQFPGAGATQDHCKFVWLFEQLRGNVGEFAMVVAGQNAGDVFNTDLREGTSQAAGRGCGAWMTPMIGDCGQGAGVPCISSVQIDTPSATETTITLAWAMPATTSATVGPVFYTLDAEDDLVNACGFMADAGNAPYYSFSPANRTAALAEMIRGWEIFYAYTAGAVPLPGARSGFTAVSDTDAGSFQFGGAGIRYSNDLTATIVVPDSGANKIVVAVSPLFDGPVAGGPGRGLPASAAKTVGTQKNISSSSDPIQPTPVSFSSFTAQYSTLQQIGLVWVTASETDALGFNVYRSLDGVNWTKINAALIPATGTGGAGATYNMTDQLPKQRVYQPWQYKVEEMSTTNQRIDETTATATK